jgi:hypothetical protein
VTSLLGCLGGVSRLTQLAKQGNAEDIRTMLTKDSSLANARSEDGTYREYAPLGIAPSEEMKEFLTSRGAKLWLAFYSFLSTSPFCASKV